MNVLDQVVKEKYAIYNGDSCEITKEIPDESIHYTVFSPPFSSLYTYSNSDRDMGNSKGDDEFYNHFIYLAKELYRITMPGRLLSFHCMDLPLMKERDGVIGLKDFPAIMRQIFEYCGVPGEKLSDFKENWETYFSNEPAALDNIHNSKTAKIVTPDATICIQPDKIALIELKEINGVPSLVVPVNGELKINGIEVELK